MSAQAEVDNLAGPSTHTGIKLCVPTEWKLSGESAGSVTSYAAPSVKQLTSSPEKVWKGCQQLGSHCPWQPYSIATEKEHPTSTEGERK